MPFFWTGIFAPVSGFVFCWGAAWLWLGERRMPSRCWSRQTSGRHLAPFRKARIFFSLPNLHCRLLPSTTAFFRVNRFFECALAL